MSLNELMLIGVLLLLPIAAVSGYYMGRKQKPKSAKKGKSSLSSDYVKGLNFLLNEQPDKAVDTFIDLLALDTETVETHMALGHLFRKRGEVDRAIRLHQNIIARPQLSAEDKNSALYELAIDYKAVGMYDRSIGLFKQLIPDPVHKKSSLERLLNIYQLTRDWQKAADTAELLQNSLGDIQIKSIAHFYCELATEKQKDGDIKGALSSLKKAFTANPKSVRASLVQGDIHLQQANYKQALKSFNKIPQQDIAFLPEALPQIQEAYNNLKDEKGYKAFLQTNLEAGAGVSILVELSKVLRQEKGDRHAAEVIGVYLQERPSLKGLHQLIALHIEHASSGAKESLKLLDNIVEKLVLQKPRYNCYNCGFQARLLHWQCPSCKEWSSVKPIQGIEGE